MSQYIYIGVESVLVDFLPKAYVYRSVPFLPHMNVAMIHLDKSINSLALASYRYRDVLIGLVELSGNISDSPSLQYLPPLLELDGSEMNAQE